MTLPVAKRKSPKILIVYASYGEGHLHAARAIGNALAARGVERIVMVDLMAAAHPWIGAFTRRFYLRSFTMLPGLYGWVYDTTRSMRHDSLFGGWLHSFGRGKMRRLLASERPDGVIHTFPMYVLPALGAKRGDMRIPSCAVVTDFDLHGRWIHPGIDRFYVPADDIRQSFVARGIAEDRVCVSGIPLKEGFRGLAPRPDYRARFGFPPDAPVVLIMAGAQGVMPDIRALCEELLRRDSLAIALVCGRNEALAASIRRVFAGHPAAGRLHVFGYVERIHELMAVSACLVTKPGGVTLAEGLAAGLPIFLYRPVPGQERGNAVYLQQRDAAVIARHPRALAAQIAKLIGDPARLDNSRQKLRPLQKQHAADTIALDFLARLNIMEEPAPSPQPAAAAGSTAITIAKGHIG